MSEQVRIRGVFFQAEGISAEGIGQLLGQLFGTQAAAPAGTLGPSPAPVVMPALPATPEPVIAERRRPRPTRRRAAAPARALTPARPSTAPTTEDQVVAAIRKGATQRAAVVQATGLSVGAVTRAVAKLVRTKRITVTGSRRSSRYVVRDGAPAKEED